MTAASVENPQQSARAGDGLRPVNLRTDLSALADLLELVFADTMDSGGRAALREMRSISRLGVGVNLMSNLNEMTFGVSTGFVWIEDGDLVGNASLYPARWHADLGKAWIIANVGVHPRVQGRGIATRLMEACLDYVRQKHAACALLQVDSDNDRARHIYQRLGFRVEREWRQWRRVSSNRQPAPPEHNLHIAHRRAAEWQMEYALAQQVRPGAQGGVGWQRPLHPSLFRRPLWRVLGDWLNMQGVERFVIRDRSAAGGTDPARQIAASLWVESRLAASSYDLTVMVAPEYRGLYDEALINYAVRRFGRHGLRIEHPADEETMQNVLNRYNFRTVRTLEHMRWDVPQR